ncbi:uncharacterized protein RHO17_024088 isoform 1-T1 [Thomomys bottae]
MEKRNQTYDLLGPVALRRVRYPHSKENMGLLFLRIILLYSHLSYAQNLEQNVLDTFLHTNSTLHAHFVKVKAESFWERFLSMETVESCPLTSSTTWQQDGCVRKTCDHWLLWARMSHWCQKRNEDAHQRGNLPKPGKQNPIGGQ